MTPLWALDKPSMWGATYHMGGTFALCAQCTLLLDEVLPRIAPMHAPLKRPKK